MEEFYERGTRNGRDASAESIRILVVDDHEVVRQGLKMFLALDEELEIVGEAEDGNLAVKRAHELQPDIVLMDLLMPGMDGIAATQAIRRELPQVQVIALTSALEDQLVYAAMRAGAIGYLMKDTRAQDLCKAIKAAAAGQVQLSPRAATRLIREVQVPESPETLTPRETEVLHLLAQGKSNQEISSSLVIALKTVKTHVGNILSKLGLSSRTQAALYAVKTGLVASGDVRSVS